MTHLKNAFVDLADWPELAEIQLVPLLSAYAKARALVWGVVNKQTLLPNQEIKDLEQETKKQKAINLEAASKVGETSRMNPDSSAGIWMTSAMRGVARRIQDNKNRHEREKEVRKVAAVAKNAALAVKKEQAFV